MPGGEEPGAEGPAPEVFENEERVQEGGGAEEDPAVEYEEESKGDAVPARGVEGGSAFEGEQEAMPAAPEDEVEAGAVPEAAEEHGEHKVEVGAGAAVAIAAEGNVEVVTEPGGKRDMPAAPEFGEGAGEVGAAEVDGEVEAEEFGHADGHVGVAGEVEEDLEGEGKGAGPGVEDAGVGGEGAEVGVAEAGEIIGEGHFFGEAEGEEEDAAGEVFGGGFAPGVEVGEEVVSADDGAGDELGEEGEKEGVIEGIADGSLLAAVNVDDVGEALKDMEADADGEDDFKWEAEAEEGFGEEVEVFEEDENAEIDGDAGDEPETAGGSGGAGDEEAGGEVDEGDGYEQGEEFEVPGGVEVVAGGEEPEAAEGKRESVEDGEDGEEEAEEMESVKEHRAPVRFRR